MLNFTGIIEVDPSKTLPWEKAAVTPVGMDRASDVPFVIGNRKVLLPPWEVTAA